MSYAVIYKRSPVGLPVPHVLATGEMKAGPAHSPDQIRELNLLLQELAWDAVTHHPLSGVTAAAQSTTRPTRH